ncbi:MAG: magnesium/cobalt transporter CorA [Thiohalocapsa sp.]|uniref:magnesium/cobalt transporter CorA n=1 Tax=Thiohalocapsa sp. TaxID=2497641 RepID=UPI0025F02A10|nr:magnesium/cobalt transporter CorA [Thiohalocapsa sp.]MCG6941419.1 magnesium/cobalt transporter CorA [Thiohalocapsa sp.]
MRAFRKRYHPPGTAPGTLAVVASEVPPQIRLIDYTPTHYEEKVLGAPAECAPFLGAESTTWIDVQGNAPPDVLRELGRLLNLHSLALEDILNKGQQAKLEEYDEHVFVVMHLPTLDESDALRVEQVSFFLARGLLVSFYGQAQEPFEPIRQRLRKRIGRLRKHGSDYLLYALLDVVVDHAFPLLESYGERIEALEDEVLEQPRQDILTKVYQLRRELLLLRRMCWPQRDVLNDLFRGDCDCIEPETTLFLRDCYDHTVQILDLVEAYREMVAGLLEVYLSSLSNRLNESMRLLTIIATLFIPLTFIAGVYGMNFGNNTESWWAMPELRWAYGYPAIWALMIGIAAVMLYLFKRNKWL